MGLSPRTPLRRPCGDWLHEYQNRVTGVAGHSHFQENLNAAPPFAALAALASVVCFLHAAPCASWINTPRGRAPVQAAQQGIALAQPASIKTNAPAAWC